MTIAQTHIRGQGYGWVSLRTVPNELWTLERLQRAFQERHGIYLSDSTIWTRMQEEGFRWKRQQSRFLCQIK